MSRVSKLLMHPLNVADLDVEEIDRCVCELQCCLRFTPVMKGIPRSIRTWVPWYNPFETQIFPLFLVENTKSVLLPTYDMSKGCRWSLCRWDTVPRTFFFMKKISATTVNLRTPIGRSIVFIRFLLSTLTVCCTLPYSTKPWLSAQLPRFMSVLAAKEERRHGAFN